MLKIPKKILDVLLNFRLKSVREAITQFNEHQDLFLPDSQQKIEEILNTKPTNEELLLEILNHDYMRPAFVVQDGDFQVPKDHPWEPILTTYKQNIKTALKSVGIFEIVKNGKKFPSGTAWVLSDDLIVTNQHVVEVFCKKTPDGYQLKKGFDTLTIDFNEEFERIDDFEFDVLEAVHVEDEDTSLYNHTPDIAILRVEKVSKNGLPLPPPLKIYDGELTPNQLIAILGFPSADYKMPVKRKFIFNNIYDVKRLQPGLIKAGEMLYDFDFRHDCATLMGNSGSPVIDIITGHVIGTHFAGSLHVFEGYAVRADVILKILEGINSSKNNS